MRHARIATDAGVVFLCGWVRRRDRARRGVYGVEMIGGLRARRWGRAGPVALVLHGGPAAAGSARGLAAGLQGAFRVVEPWQRGAGWDQLTVAAHVADLHAVVEEVREGTPPVLVGESWGAMLALAYAAAHPGSAGPIALVGCGTFEPAARARLMETLAARMTPELRARIAEVERTIADPGERMGRVHALDAARYDADADPDPPDPDTPPFDLRAHTETWTDMLRAQHCGEYPAAFQVIRTPVAMFHGAYDPHPGGMIRDSLLPHIPHLEYREWDRCGHSPWRERAVRAEFLQALRDWLLARA